jgi:hypothetical protein
MKAQVGPHGDNQREVDAHGHCSKCGGTHYGSYYCPISEQSLKEMQMPEANLDDLRAHVAAQMPRYKCHKEVYALKIDSLRKVQNDDDTYSIWLTPADKGYAPFALDREYLARNKPEVGGYYVVYDDGYKSYSPAKAFEEGYTRLPT